MNQRPFNLDRLMETNEMLSIRRDPKGRAAGIIRCLSVMHRAELKEFAKFMGANVSDAEQTIVALLMASDIHARQYFEFLKARPGETPRLRPDLFGFGETLPMVRREACLSKNTIRKKWYLLRAVYQKFHHAGLIPANSFASAQTEIQNFPKAVAEKRPTEMIPYETVSELLRLPDLAEVKGRRDHAILCCMFSGMRRGEVAALTLANIGHTAAGTVSLSYIQKGGDAMEKGLAQWAGLSVMRYAKLRIEQGAGLDDSLFNITDSAMWYMFKLYCAKVGIAAWTSPHSARATAVTKLLDDGLSHREVQRLSGHKSVAMVEHYDKARIGVDEDPTTTLDYGKKIA